MASLFTIVLALSHISPLDVGHRYRCGVLFPFSVFVWGTRERWGSVGHAERLPVRLYCYFHSGVNSRRTAQFLVGYWCTYLYQPPRSAYLTSHFRSEQSTHRVPSPHRNNQKKRVSPKMRSIVGLR